MGNMCCDAADVCLDGTFDGVRRLRAGTWLNTYVITGGREVLAQASRKTK